MCVIAVVGVAPCQCFSRGGNQTTSPGRISSTGPPSRCAQPVCPSGCVYQALRAVRSNVTLALATGQESAVLTFVTASVSLLEVASIVVAAGSKITRLRELSCPEGLTQMLEKHCW